MAKETCISPLNIPHPSKDERLSVPCGKCLYCLKRLRSDWTFRLEQEQKISETGNFLTLTYNDENRTLQRSLDEKTGEYFEEYTLVKKDLQDFMKRLRYYNSQKWKSLIRYYAVGEYGTETDRPHYHIILFNLHTSLVKDLDTIWSKGNILNGSVSPASIRYVTKYVINKIGTFDTKLRPFSLMSKGIGKNYIDANKKYHNANKILSVRHSNGSFHPLPRYYRDKMFSPIELQAAQVQLQKTSDLQEMEERQNMEKLGKSYGKKYIETHENRIRRAENTLNKKNIL